MIEDKMTKTNRVCTEIDSMLGQKMPVLDHGFITIVDYMGDDEAIVQSARVSYGKGTSKKSNTAGLINYLMKHNHSSPFEMCDIKFHLKMPIFVARQWLRHRTASVNEYSARYSILSNEFYTPEQTQITKQSSSNNQGRSDEILENANEIRETLINDSQQCYENYNQMVDSGYARELARANLPVSVYTEFYWKINLHNLLHFVALRADSHSQYEIMKYAEIILDQIIKKWVPITYDAFMNHNFNGKKMSAKEIIMIQQMIKGAKTSQEESGLSKRDWSALMDIFDK